MSRKSKCVGHFSENKTTKYGFCRKNSHKNQESGKEVNTLATVHVLRGEIFNLKRKEQEIFAISCH